MNALLISDRDTSTLLRKGIIVLLVIVLAALLFIPGNNWSEGPAPSMTGKVISITPTLSQKDTQGDILLGTVLIQRTDGYQLLLRVYHASGDGCLGSYALHLSDIQVGETVTTRYWLDTPDTAANPHKGHAVYINNQC
jgi:hypothetical protein